MNIKIQVRFQRITYRKCHLVVQAVTRSMTAHNSKLARLSPDIFRCKYLKKTTKDRDWGPKGHQSKLAYGESNTHVTDDIFLIIPY